MRIEFWLRHSRAVLVSVTVSIFVAVTACGSSAQSVGDNSYPILPTDELVEVGRPLYQENCASCHGSATTRPPVPFAPPHTEDGHTWHHPDRNLVDWILDGVPLAVAMPEFRGRLTEQQVRSVLAYIKTFWPKHIQDQQIEGSDRFEQAFNSQ